MTTVSEYVTELRAATDGLRAAMAQATDAPSSTGPGRAEGMGMSRAEPSQSALRAVHTALTTGHIDDEGAGEAQRLGLLEVHYGLYSAPALGTGDCARPTHDGLVALAMRWRGDD